MKRSRRASQWLRRETSPTAPHPGLPYALYFFERQVPRKLTRDEPSMDARHPLAWVNLTERHFPVNRNERVIRVLTVDDVHLNLRAQLSLTVLQVLRWRQFAVQNLVPAVPLGRSLSVAHRDE